MKLILSLNFAKLGVRLDLVVGDAKRGQGSGYKLEDHYSNSYQVIPQPR